MQYLATVFGVLVLANVVLSLPTGPPAGQINQVCILMTPSHGAPAQSGNGGYVITTDLPFINATAGYSYVAGQNATVNLTGTMNTFRGYVVIAHVPGQNNTLLGQFVPQNASQQTYNCDPVGVNAAAAITHNNPDPRIDFTSMQFMWQAPADANGTVDFRFTAVQQFNTYYVAQSAAQVQSVQPGPPTPPMRDPEDYRLTFRQPPNCQLADCNVFVGIDTNVDNPTFLDITMQGVADGWLAVGFSLTQNMFDADVVGCVRDPANDNVTAIDTYNDPNVRNNIQDATQDVTLFNSSFINGTISCTFVRPIMGSDPTPQDRPLNSPYFIIYGYRGAANPASAVMSFPVHAVSSNATPTSSPGMLNPATDSNQPFAGVMVPMRDPEDYRLTFRTPPGCNVSNCTTFVGIDTNTGNNGVLDIYMEGEALGWVAVGFTATRSMFSADVVACNRDPITNMVEALDTYNVPSPGRNNLVDASQDVLLFNSSFDGTRINCTVGKTIAPSDLPPQDINLNSDLFVLWGIRADNSTAGMIPAHSIDPRSDIPAASNATVNPAGMAVGLATPARVPTDSRLIFRAPPNCDLSTCNIFVGIDTNTGNPGFLDIYIEGNSQGWVAVGFSDSQNMFSADVVGCNRDPATDMIAAVDTWNVPSPGRLNTLDVTQDVVLFQGSFTNGRISCSVAKQIAPSDADQDLDLSTRLFVMYGTGPTGSGAQSLLPHNLGNADDASANPLRSQGRFNAAADAGGDVPFPTVNLLRAHGILMLISWPLLAVSGIFFAAWMRPAMPNGEWFKIHQGFLLASLFVGVLGFSLAFIANVPNGGLIVLGSTNPVGTAHYAIGIIVTLLQIVNPIIASFRCGPGDKHRWIFNLIHGSTIGLFVELLALTNIALGLARFGPASFFSDLTIMYVYIGYLIFFLVLTGVLFLFFTVLALFTDDGDRKKIVPSIVKPLLRDNPHKGEKPPAPANQGVELAIPGEKPNMPNDGPPKPKMPSKDAPIRWGALSVFLAVNVIVLVILIILIAIE